MQGRKVGSRKCRDCGRVFGSAKGLAVHRGVKHPAIGRVELKLGVEGTYQKMAWEAEQQEELGQMVSPTFNELAVDMINAPPHYNAGGHIECIEAIQASLTETEFRGFLKGQVMKYVWRERLKGGDQDISKAKFYLDMLEMGYGKELADVLPS